MIETVSLFNVKITMSHKIHFNRELFFILEVDKMTVLLPVHIKNTTVMRTKKGSMGKGAHALK
jgi:hypothetical protein